MTSASGRTSAATAPNAIAIRRPRLIVVRSPSPGRTSPTSSSRTAARKSAPQGAQRDEGDRGVGAEQFGKDAGAGVGVVQEEHEVTEAHQHVGAVAGPGERLDAAVHVAHHVDPHGAEPKVRAARRPSTRG